MVSPMETMEITDPIPMIMPSIVGTDRFLLARIARNAISIFSIIIRPPSHCLPRLAA